jgi:ribitol-5-phosphate 2-dehydrogenase
VRPEVLAICAADQRYFQGRRSPEVLKRKLPMSLIHEGVGTVLFDPENRIPRGSHVILLPFGPNAEVGQNYAPNAYFRSSNADGFMQEVMFLNREEVLPIEKPFSKHFVFAEMLSVCFQAMRQIPVSDWQSVKRAGIWGDGVIGYLMTCCLKAKYPHIHLTVFGKTESKLALFTQADSKINIFSGANPEKFDLAFECVGGSASETAIDHAVNLLKPAGALCLMGVSELKVPINTRLVLEKGLRIYGSSRSVLADFIEARDLLQKSGDFSWIDKVISSEVTINNLSDLTEAFKQDRINPYKTLLHWNM